MPPATATFCLRETLKLTPREFAERIGIKEITLARKDSRSKAVRR